MGVVLPLITGAIRGVTATSYASNHNQSPITSKFVCDPSVSALEKNGRLIYLLGTAHISSSSAALAGQLVRETLPEGVFVELDHKRFTSEMDISFTPEHKIIVPKISAVEGDGGLVLFSGDSINGISPDVIRQVLKA
jgi:hypothetical protein